MKRSRVLLMGFLFLFVLTQVGGGAPKKQEITIQLIEFAFKPNRITLTKGVPVELKLSNKGSVTHEFMVYAPPKAGMSMEELEKWAEEKSYFKGVEVTVEGAGIEVVGKDIFEVEIEKGKSVEIKFTPIKAGTFEIGCHLPGHYEAGMKGTMVVK
ncbi:MAG: cupredoxin domain-containing protein [Armatimonadota bacterium]|nr:cupredoxin domain-containing protein [Armatimonadota bacterium]MDR5702517.1 cupredoxin domain-containing protein [Armatimonadota bacterium]MDR7434037.1 cupredoxin domain-containing protein [Armatimonadota bacterium]